MTEGPFEQPHQTIRPTEINQNGKVVLLREITPEPPDGLIKLQNISRSVCTIMKRFISNEDLVSKINNHLKSNFWQCDPYWIEKKELLKEVYSITLTEGDVVKVINIYNFLEILTPQQLQELERSIVLYTSFFGIDAVGIDSILISDQNEPCENKINRLSEKEKDLETKKRGGKLVKRGNEEPKQRAFYLFPASASNNNQLWRQPYDESTPCSTLMGTLLHELVHCNPDPNLQNEFDTLVGWINEDGPHYKGKPDRKFPTPYAKIDNHDHLAESVVSCLSGTPIEDDIRELIEKRRRHASIPISSEVKKNEDVEFPPPPEEIMYYYWDLYIEKYKAQRQ